MSKQAISTPLAPAAIGPYSQAIRSGNLLFVSGQIPLDPATGQIVEGDAAVQTAAFCKISRPFSRPQVRAWGRC